MVDSATPRASRGKASRPSRWSKSPWVATRASTSKPACASTPGSSSSSSGKYGESISMLSPLARSAVAVVCHIRLVRTRASRWTETARKGPRPPPPSGGLEQLGRVAQGLDFLGRLLLARLEPLAGAVDPDHRNPLLQARLDVGGVARGDVHPVPPLPLDAARAFLEVRRVGLVRTNLLRGHDEVEIGAEVTPGGAEQLVVDVRQDAH